MKRYVLTTLVVSFGLVVSLLTAPTAVSIQDVERDVLVALYHSTNGDSWSRNDNWLDKSIPHCDWYGVECDSEGRVQSLRLAHNQLIGSIPPELGSLTNLTYLRLAWNQLGGSIPPELGTLTTLTHFDLAINQLSGSIPVELSNLSSLTYFDLGWNQLSGSIPPELGKLSNLGDLRLYANNLNGSIPPELGNLSDLFFLELYGNQLSGPIPQELSSLSNMEWLRLHDNQLTCWQTEGVLNWALKIPRREWDYPNPGEVVCPDQPLSGNIVQNPRFEEGEAPWRFYSSGWGGFETATPAYDGAFAARVEVGSAASNVQLFQYNLPLEPNQKYKLYFAAKSNDKRAVSIHLHKHGWPYTNYAVDDQVLYADLDTEWQQYAFDLTTNSLATADGRLRFWLAPYAAAGNVYWFDNIYLLKITDGVPDPPDPDPQDPPVPPFGHCREAVSGNVISNPGFEASTMAPWSFWTNGQAVAVQDPDRYECEQGARVTIWQEGSNVQLFQPGLFLQPNTSYRLRLAAKSSDGRDVRLYLHKHRFPYTNYGLNGLPLDLTDEWQVFVVQFTTTGFTAPVTDGRLRVWLAGSDAANVQYTFDDVVMTPLDSG
jgi:hypothetical protein